MQNATFVNSEKTVACAAYKNLCYGKGFGL